MKIEIKTEGRFPGDKGYAFDLIHIYSKFFLQFDENEEEVRKNINEYFQVEGNTANNYYTESKGVLEKFRLIDDENDITEDFVAKSLENSFVYMGMIAVEICNTLDINPILENKNIDSQIQFIEKFIVRLRQKNELFSSKNKSQSVIHNKWEKNARTKSARILEYIWSCNGYAVLTSSFKVKNTNNETFFSNLMIMQENTKQTDEKIKQVKNNKRDEQLKILFEKEIDVMLSINNYLGVRNMNFHDIIISNIGNKKFLEETIKFIEEKKYSIYMQNGHNLESYGDAEKKNWSPIGDNRYLYNEIIFNITDTLEYKTILAKYEIIYETNNAIQKIYIGPPGSGKSYGASQMCDTICTNKSDITRVVFHPEYENSDFIGSILPFSKRDGKVSYRFTPGPFTLILEKAINSPHKKYILLIEEMTRGNCAAIFGDLFQLLDRDKLTGVSQYPISNHNMQEYLKVKNIVIPSNLGIIGTVNSSDQNVFPMDTAFKRRFSLKYVNAIEEGFEANDFEILGYKWSNLCSAINHEICKIEHLAEDKQIGFYFIEKPNSVEESIENLQKLCIYLWHDVDKFIHENKNKVLAHDEEINNFGMFSNTLLNDNTKIEDIFSKAIVNMLAGINE